MLERGKWQKELLVFNRLVNTIVLTGNVNDQYPIINEKEQRIQGFCSLDVYLARNESKVLDIRESFVMIQLKDFTTFMDYS